MVIGNRLELRVKRRFEFAVPTRRDSTAIWYCPGSLKRTQSFNVRLTMIGLRDKGSVPPRTLMEVITGQS